MPTNKEIKALISLLDDPDEAIFANISNKLLSLGDEVIPELENAWEHSFDSLIQSRIEGIIHKIQLESLLDGIRKWKTESSTDLLTGALLIAKYQYPDLDEEKLKKQLYMIRQDVWLELNDHLTALEKVKIINHILFDVHGFSGNRTNYHSPQNSYINNVLETKKGSPLLLSIIYIHIAQSLGIPIYGVNLPEHFVLAYRDESKILPAIASATYDDVLFYINPFSRGVVFSRKEILDFIQQLKLTPIPEYYLPCNNIDIIKRLLRNLMVAYNKLGYQNKMDELTIIIKALE